MVWYVTIVHLVLSILLFYFVNWMGKGASPLGYMQMSVVVKEDTAPLFNYLFKVLAPVVYIILLTALFQKCGLDEFTKGIYLIVVEYWIFRLLYVILLGHIRLLDWWTQIFYWISSIGLAIWFQSMVNKVDTILPDPKNLIEELWILIIAFLYSIINKKKFAEEASENRKKQYIIHKYNRLKSKFGGVVCKYCNNEFAEALLFSIMINENFNRPKAARCLERVLFAKSSKRHSYGIMQVMSDRVLTDEESIELAAKKINDSMGGYIATAQVSYDNRIWTFDIIDFVAKDYNNGDQYGTEIQSIFNVLKDVFYPVVENSYSLDDDFVKKYRNNL